MADKFTPQEQGLLNYHRKNLKNGTYLEDSKGITTVYITGVTGPDGKEYNVPGYRNGKRLSGKEAWDAANKEGWGKYPSYNSVADANAGAARMHKVIESDTAAFEAKRQRERKLFPSMKGE